LTDQLLMKTRCMCIAGLAEGEPAR